MIKFNFFQILINLWDTRDFCWQSFRISLFFLIEKNLSKTGTWHLVAQIVFYHILENLYHIALYHIFKFSKSLSYYTLSYSQKVYHIQFIILNMIKSPFIHTFAIWYEKSKYDLKKSTFASNPHVIFKVPSC